MSSDKQTKEGTTPAQQATQPDQALVIEQDSYVFGSYQDDATFKDHLDVRPLYGKNINPEAYDVRWFRHNEQTDAKDRFFTKVMKDVHGKAGWFKMEAFDNLRGTIGRGHEFMADGKPEVELFIRTKAAAEAERQQMITLSEHRRDPFNDEKFQQNVEGMQQALAPSGSHVTNNSKRITSSPWPKS